MFNRITEPIEYLISRVFHVNGFILLAISTIILLAIIKRKTIHRLEQKGNCINCYSCSKQIPLNWGYNRKGGVCTTCDRFVCCYCLENTPVPTKNILRKHQRGPRTSTELYNLCKMCISRKTHEGLW